ncbi:MAG: DMT family transporter [Hyphomicrobiaceae bacterium]
MNDATPPSDPTSATKRWQLLSPTAQAILLMIFSTFAFAGMNAAIRHVTKELPPIEVAFFRNFFGLIVFLPVVFWNGFGFLRTKKFHLHALRAVLNVTSMFAYFTALSMTPVARVTALGFTAPLFTAVLSVYFLGERFRLRRWTAIGCGFLGTLVILRPGLLEIDTGSLLTLFSASLWGVTLILIKVMGRTESSMTITGYANLLLSALALVPAILVWQSPSPDGWIWLMVIGVSGTFGQLAVAEALRLAEATALMPLDFLKLIWVAILGYVFFAESLDTMTWIGAVIVFTSGFYIAYRESQVKKSG